MSENDETVDDLMEKYTRAIAVEIKEIEVVGICYLLLYPLKKQSLCCIGG